MTAEQADGGTTARRERFEQLVQRAEQLIETAPRAYRVRIALLAVLGYLVVFGVLALLVALLGGTVWAAFASTALFLLLVKKKLILVLAVMAWVLLKALWVRFERPQGIRVTAKQAPALFAELKALRRTLALPRIHEVLLTDDFNAAIAQSPRLGVLGWQRNSLILGVPLMLALAPQEMRAVLAHEAGHLSGNHSRFNGWIYRVRTTWMRVMEAFDGTDGFGAGLLRRFFDWYAPYFSAMSFALARANEYEADAVAVELTSPAATASALTAAAVRGEVANEAYWQPLVARAVDVAEPERAPYHGLARFHTTHDVAEDALAQRIEAALGVTTGHADTHPSLADRLRAIGAPPGRRFRPDENAAQAWLGEALPRILDTLDETWHARNDEAWRAHHAHTREAREQLAALAARPLAELESMELWQLATLTAEHGDAAEALALYEAYAAREPDDRDADFVVGRLLLERDDAGGLAHLERACASFKLVLPACEIAYDWHLRAGNAEQAHAWRLRGERQIDLRDRAQAERAGLRTDDTFSPSGLPRDAIDALAAQLADVDDISAAWIATKDVSVAPEFPVYVVAVEKRRWTTNTDKLVAWLAEHLEAPGECFYIARAGDAKAIAKKVISVGEQLR